MVGKIDGNAGIMCFAGKRGVFWPALCSVDDLCEGTWNSELVGFEATSFGDCSPNNCRVDVDAMGNLLKVGALSICEVGENVEPEG